MRSFCDSSWEAELARVIERNPHVIAYVKNQGLNFEVPYRDGATPRRHLPDFIVRVDDGHDEPLNLVLETKGYRGRDAQLKAETMKTLWVPGVNNLGDMGVGRLLSSRTRSKSRRRSTSSWELHTEGARMTETDEFGRLEVVPLREAWQHEALRFTPWLAAISTGSATRSESLWNSSRPKHGSRRSRPIFSPEIPDSDSIVFIENQLE